ncbi:DUF3261 domain-containing protein [Serratia microhaemolytica]|uniref:DUF3261 domain-containing protein n=1 Tax=Serratia microhaemolytica TaxID=2675110 RepID=UPI000FDED50F|nr:DUF3261 domain-containing protein [Serratia microhaemolytica]
MIKPQRWQWLALISLLLLNGCQQRSHDDRARPTAWLQPGVRVNLPPPAISPALNVQQLLTGSVNGNAQSLVVLLTADENQVKLVGLSSVGIRLFLIRYDQQGLHSEQSIVLPQLPSASQVLADVMLSHWPLSAWQAQLPRGWSLADVGDKRELRNAAGKLVTEIHYQQRNGLREPISLQQHVFNYHITIQHLGD